MLGRSRNDTKKEFVMDWEWVFPQLLVAMKSLRELLSSVRHAYEGLDPFDVSLGMGECIFDLSLGYVPGVSLRRNVPSVTIRCGVSDSLVESDFSVDPSCLLEFAEGLERIAAVASQARG